MIEIIAVIVVMWFMYTWTKSQPVQPTPAPVTQPDMPTDAPSSADLAAVELAKMHCSGGIYCDGTFVPDSLTEVGGAAICGAGNYQYTCVDSLGTPRWRTDREPCSADAVGKCR